MPLEDVVITPMDKSLLLWRCLHSGPLSPENIDAWPPNNVVPWEACRMRNLPLLDKLTNAYGACAMLARDGDRVVGTLRFYPKAISEMPEAGQMCLQQIYPAGPSAELVEKPFLPLHEIADKTLSVHCLMVGSPQQKDNTYQRKGLGSRLVRELIAWAQAQGWEAIEATAYEDVPIIYEITGQAGRRWWERLGFHLVKTDIEPEFLRENEFVQVMRQQAAALGLDTAMIQNKYIMRIELAGHKRGDWTEGR
jgi:N-acetylglutamate synthase-like GNAT family acetyltransferase